MRKSLKHSPEVRDGAVRMVFEHQGEHESQWTAICSISVKFGCALVRPGLKVCVTAVSHKVIVNLLEGVAEQACADETGIAIVHRQGEYESEFGIRRETSYDSNRAALESGEIDVLGATVWCRTRSDFEQQAIVHNGDADSALTGSRLIYVPVHHAENRPRSLEETEVIAYLDDELSGRCNWRNKDRVARPLTGRDILVLAPYNAQVPALVEALHTLGGHIGTVDRFQGQKAPNVIFSMTSSSPAQAPREMAFLYNRFRFNVPRLGRVLSASWSAVRAV